MSLGLTAEKLLLILLIVAMLIGPERLPRYTSTVTRLAKAAKRTLHSAQQRVREEMGPEFDDIDWKKLDPRRYDPRQIVRAALTADALTDPSPAADSQRGSASPSATNSPPAPASSSVASD